MSTARSLSVTLLLIVGPALAGCGPDSLEAGATWEGTVDTLPSGTIAVTNPAEGIWDASTGWRVEQDLRIGTIEGDGPDLFGQITDVQVDAMGRIWVLEGQAQEIRVFDTDGAHVRTIGRAGGGPGEFARPLAMDWGPGGHLWVVDPQNTRISVIDTAGTFLRSVRMPGGFIVIPWPGRFDDAGRLYTLVPLASETGFSTAMVQYDTAMTPLDTIRPPTYEGPGEFFELSNESGRMRMTVPFTAGLQTRLGAAGTFWALHTGDYRLFEISFAGDTLRTITRAFEPIPVTDDDIERAIEGMEWFISQGGKVDRSRIPDTKPPVTNFVVDDEGNIWVAREDAGDRERTALVDVFDARGRYLGEVTLPFTTSWGRVPRVLGGHVYTVARDDLDVPYVVRARIVRPDPE